MFAFLVHFTCAFSIYSRIVNILLEAVIPEPLPRCEPNLAGLQLAAWRNFIVLEKLQKLWYYSITSEKPVFFLENSKIQTFPKFTRIIICQSWWITTIFSLDDGWYMWSYKRRVWEVLKNFKGHIRDQKTNKGPKHFLWYLFDPPEVLPTLITSKSSRR